MNHEEIRAGSPAMTSYRYCTVGFCENPNSDPAHPALNGSPLEHLVFVGLDWTARREGVCQAPNLVTQGDATFYLGGILARPSILSVGFVKYLNHGFNVTVMINNATSGIVSGVLNGEAGTQVEHPALWLALTSLDVYSSVPLPFKVTFPAVATQIPLTLPQAHQSTAAVTHLNIPIQW